MLNKAALVIIESSGPFCRRYKIFGDVIILYRRYNNSIKIKTKCFICIILPPPPIPERTHYAWFLLVINRERRVPTSQLGRKHSDVFYHTRKRGMTSDLRFRGKFKHDHFGITMVFPQKSYTHSENVWFFDVTIKRVIGHESRNIVVRIKVKFTNNYYTYSTAFWLRHILL